MTFSKPKDIDYLKELQHELAQSRPVSMDAFRAFCLAGLEVKRAFPESRSEVAYLIVGASAAKGNDDEGSIVQQIAHLVYDLELPDPHVYIGDGLSVDQKWEKLEALIRQL